jgi:hypothetical protein
MSDLWGLIWCAKARHQRWPPIAGIATGLVVVGDLLGSGAAQEQAVVGETLWPEFNLGAMTTSIDLVRGVRHPCVNLVA